MGLCKEGGTRLDAVGKLLAEHVVWECLVHGLIVGELPWHWVALRHLCFVIHSHSLEAGAIGPVIRGTGDAAKASPSAPSRLADCLCAGREGIDDALPRSAYS